MILYWILTGLGVISLLLSIPIQIMVDSKPKFVSKISWFFFQIRLETTDSNMAVSYHFFGYQISRNKKKKTKKKAPKKERKKRKRKITFSLIKEIITHSSIPKISGKIGRLLRHFAKSFSIKRLHWDIAINDYFVQGILHGLILSLPRTERVAIGSNFEESNSFFIQVQISVFKLIGAVLLLLITFPYLDSLRLYKKIRLAP